MKVLVAYKSQTGNTKKIAEAIYNEIQEEKEIRTWNDIESFEGYDLTFVGFPIHQFGVDEQERTFLEKHTKDKKIVVFVTHATPPEAPYLQPQLDKCKDAVAEANLVGFFNCQGELSIGIANALKKMDNPEMQKFGEMRDVTLGHPTDEEVEKSREFAREIVENTK